MTQKELKKYVVYDKESGIFSWIRIPKRVQAKIGDIVGNDCRGYLFATIHKERGYLHRWVWIYMFDNDPSEQIDHINHDRSDNRLSNLRLVSNQENHKNRTLNVNNKSGVIGVFWSKSRKRWYSSITIDGENIFLGRFINFHEAVNARKNAEILYGFHDNHGKDFPSQS